MNAINYVQVKKEFQLILIKAGWDPKYEFKGSYLFSASKGDPNISVESRVGIAQKILDLNTANKNARMNFHYFHKDSSNHKKDYLAYVPSLLDKALTKANHKGGKDLLTLHCDHRNDISIEEIRNVALPIIKKKGYTLFEEIQMPISCFHTVGILYADIVAYLRARVETIGNDSELFDNVPKEEWINNGKIKKYLSSTILLDKIKKIKVYEVKEK